jgi:hypothetical protein
MSDTAKDTPAPAQTFLEASKTETPGLVADFVLFLKENKKWWLVPFLVVFGLVGAVVIVAALAPGAVPFLYTLF